MEVHPADETATITTEGKVFKIRKEAHHVRLSIYERELNDDGSNDIGPLLFAAALNPFAANHLGLSLALASGVLGKTEGEG